jgi:hypothetical protein
MLLSVVFLSANMQIVANDVGPLGTYLKEESRRLARRVPGMANDYEGIKI